MQTEKMKIFAIIVLYNKQCKDSITFQSICNQKEIQIIICDNSTSDFQNKEFAEQYGAVYLSMDGNVGLPKAYNRAIDWIGSQDGLLCLFDDDTQIDSDYFTKLISVASNQKSDIFLPMVYDEIGLLSPSIMKKYYCHRSTDISEIGRDITGINSGMAIRMSVFRNYRYNENMFLDFVDHAFIRDMRKQGKNIGIMEDVVLHQAFSANVNSKNSAINRFKILKKDLKCFYNEDLYSFFYYCYVIMKRKARLCLQYKTLVFLFL